MSLKPEQMPPIPEETKRVAKAAFPTPTCRCVMNWGRFIRTPNLRRCSLIADNPPLPHGDSLESP